MSRINMSRWILGGVVAGVVINAFEFLGGIFYADQMNAAAKAHSLSMDMGAGTIALGMGLGILMGLVAVWFYAVARDHFGPGPGTAVKVGLALWLGGYFLHLIGYGMMGLFSTSTLMTWGVVSLIEMLAGTLAGAAVYKESAR